MALPGFIPGQEFKPNVGAGFGQGFTTGLAEALQGLARQRAFDLQQRQQASQLTSALQGLGYKPEIAGQLSQFGPELLKPLIQAKAQEQQYTTAAQGLRQLIPELSAQEASAISALPPSLQAPFYKQYLEAPALPKTAATATLPEITEALGQRPQAQTQEATQVPLASLFAQQQSPFGAPISPMAAPVIPAPAAKVAEIGLTPEEKAAKEKRIEEHRGMKNSVEQLEHAEKNKSIGEKVKEARYKKEEEHKAKIQQESINKEFKPVVMQNKKEAKGAHEANLRLDRMEALIDKGNLAYPVWAGLLKTIKHGIFGVGIDLEGILNADSQEFNKLSQDFLVGVKDVVGNRVTNYEIQAYLSRIPSLTQSDAGKRRVIHDLKLFNEVAIERDKLGSQIIKENDNKIPPHFDALLEERMAPVLDSVASRFKEGYKPKSLAEYESLGTMGR